MTKEKAYIYVRISLSDDRQHIEHQINATKEYCLKNNLEVIDIIEDIGTSAYRKDYKARSGINKILELSHNKQLPNLVVFESSRISRRMLETQLLIAQLTENGTAIHSVTEGIINSKDNELSELLNSIRAFNNQSSSKQTSNRIISSKKLLAQNRGWQGGALPYGYTVDKDNRIIINEEQRELVVDMFTYYLNHTSKQTIDFIRDKYGVELKRSLSMYLDKKIYIGKPYSQEETKDFYFKELQLIDDDLFYQVQDLIKSRRQKGYTKTNKSSMLLEGLLYCKNCNTKYYISYDLKKDKYGNKLQYTYYRRKCKCEGKKTHSTIKVDDEVSSLVSEFFNSLSKDLLLDKFQKERSKYYKQLLIQEQMKNNLLSNKRTIMTNAKKKLEQAILNDMSNDFLEVITSSISDLKPQIEQLELELKEIKDNITNEERLVKQQVKVSDDLLDMKNLYNNYATVEEKKILLNNILDRVYIDENREITLEYKFGL